MEENSKPLENEKEIDGLNIREIDRERLAKKASSKKDEFLLAGLYGDESYLHYIEKLEEEKNDVTEKELEYFEDRKEYEQGKINRHENEIKKEEKNINSLFEKEGIVKEALNKTKNELSKLYASFLQLSKTLIGKRKGYRDELLKKKIAARTEFNSELTSSLVEEQKKKLEYEEKLFNISEQRYKKNEKEYNRRISLFDAKRKLAEDRFNKFDEYVDVLRKFGITRTSSGFLIWSSYLGFVAFGWFIGEIIIKKLKPNNSFISMFADAIKELVPDRWMGVLLAVLLPLVIILIYILLLYFSNYLQRRFNPYIEKRSMKQKNESRSKSFLDIFFTNSSTDYSTIISKLPLVYFWTIVPLIVAVVLPGAFDSTSNLMYSPMDTAVFTYFGIVLCIVFSGFVLVYSLKVIEPRIQTKIVVLMKKDEIIRPSMFLWFNIELVVTLTFIVIGFLSIGVVEISNPESGFWENNNSIIILLLLLLCSFVLSYGIIYRGVFREHLALKRTLYLYEKEIEKYSVMPVLEVDNTIFYKYAEELDNLQIEIDKIWNLEDLWKIPEDFSNNLFERFSNIFKLKTNTPARESNYSLNKLINADFVFENELTNELLESEEKIRRLTNELEDQGKVLRSIESEKESIKKNLSALKDGIETVKRNIIWLNKELNDKVQYLREYYNTLKFELKNAYNIGRSIKQIKKLDKNEY